MAVGGWFGGCTVTITSSWPLAPWSSVTVRRKVKAVVVATVGAVKLAVAVLALVRLTTGLAGVTWVQA